MISGKYMTKASSFDDVLLIPGFFSGKSRNEVSISSKISGLELETPIISANMPSVTDVDMCRVMHKMGGLGILHRMNGLDYEIEQSAKLKDEGCIHGVSVGYQFTDEQLERLVKTSDIVCLDVAHAAQEQTTNFYRKFRRKYPNKPLILFS